MGVRTQGQTGSADPPPGKMDEKLKSENIQKRAVFGISELIIMFMLYFESNLGRQV